MIKNVSDRMKMYIKPHDECCRLCELQKYGGRDSICDLFGFKLKFNEYNMFLRCTRCLKEFGVGGEENE